MATFNTVFKNIFGEALKEYGFVKIKGRQPYYVRVIGDEIIHVITYKSEWCATSYLKAFTVLGGIATVYKGALTLDDTPKSNSGWLDNIESMHIKYNRFYGNSEYENYCGQFEYVENNEKSMTESVEKALKLVKQIMLPILEKVKTLQACVDYYYMMRPIFLKLYCNEDVEPQYNDYRYDEGILELKIFDIEEYTARKLLQLETKNKQQIYLKNDGKKEQQKMCTNREKEMREQIDLFQKLKSDPVKYAKIEEELERRKKVNIEYLKKYGI